jgi:hypothetical protein
MKYNTKELIESALIEVRNLSTKASRLVEIYNGFGLEQVKLFVPKSKGNERCAEVLEVMLSRFAEEGLLLENKPETSIKETDTDKIKTKKSKGVQVSFDGSDFVGISGTKIKLWKDAKSIQLTGKFSLDQEKYYKDRFNDKITYVK